MHSCAVHSCASSVYICMRQRSATWFCVPVLLCPMQMGEVQGQALVMDVNNDGQVEIVAGESRVMCLCVSVCLCLCV